MICATCQKSVTIGYLVKSGDLLIGPRERKMFKTKRGARELDLSVLKIKPQHKSIVMVAILEESEHETCT